MREIKFRAWMVTFPNEPKSMRFYTIKNLGEMEKDIRSNPSAPIMQYTGVKDKNGEEIYEGDIVESKKKGVDSYYGIGKVEWAERSFYIPGVGTNFLEVVGNIYENPELLNDKK